jgi:hypothetical protein
MLAPGELTARTPRLAQLAANSVSRAAPIR